MIFTAPQGDMRAWAMRHVDEINRFHPPVDLWPIFANDAAAAAGNLKIGRGYVTPDGAVRRRMA
jgi:hypothetical protein